jgi:hypothetical protein
MSIPPELTTAVKLLRARKALAATVMALMVGGGLTLAAYSVIHAALLTPLPWSQPDRIVRVWDASSAQEQLRLLDAPAIDALAGQPRPFSSIAAFLTLQQQLTLPSGKTVDVSGALVSDRIFDVLGVRAISGRVLTPGDGDISPLRPIVIGQRLVDAGLVTERLDDIVRIDGDAYRIVGIVGRDFWFPDRQTRYWAPLPLERREAVAATASYGAIARLAPSVTADIAEAQATAQLASDGTSRPVRVQSYGDTLLEPLRPALAALEATAASLLALVFLNVAWLFAARARRMTTTFATLRALGATERSVLWTYLLMAAMVGLVAAPGVVLVASGMLRVAATLESGTISKVADLALTRVSRRAPGRRARTPPLVVACSGARTRRLADLRHVRAGRARVRRRCHSRVARAGVADDRGRERRTGQDGFLDPAPCRSWRRRNGSHGANRERE